MKKKILFIGMSSNYGGLETFMMSVFKKLSNDSYCFDFVRDFSNGEIAYENEIKENGGRIWKVPILDRKNKRPLIKYFIRKKLVKKFFNEHDNYDVIHINALNINGIIFWIKEAKKHGIKVVLHMHLDKIDNIIPGSGFKESNLDKIKFFISKLLMLINLNYINKNKDIIRVAASQKSGDNFFNGTNFEIIDNGIEVDKYKFSIENRLNHRSKLGISDDVNVVMTVARISRQKNYPKIIKIFRYIKKYRPKSKLVIVGGGECFDEIVSMVNDFGLRNDVLFLGLRKDVNTILSIADLVLMPSLLEAFPFALIEAQAAGVPCLVSKNVIPEEENITGKLTYLSLSDSDQYWAKTANEILDNNQNIVEKLNMYEQVKKSNYNLSNSIKKIKKIYDL